VKSDRRQIFLKIAAIGAVTILLLDYAVITPLIGYWRTNTEEITKLQREIERGRQILDREKSIRTRWSEMLQKDLADDGSAAENDIIKAFSRCAQESRTAYTSLTPQWQTHEQTYQTLEIRANLTGDQPALCRLLYELETDPLPIRLEECEFTARNDKGQQLNLNVRFSALRLSVPERKTR